MIMESHPTHEAGELHGDHPALDLMNTLATVDGVPVERWHGDAEVLDWLRRTLGPEVELPDRAPAGLLAAARALRERLRRLVQARKDEGRVDVKALNELLARAPRQLLLREEEDGTLRIARRHGGAANDALLAPVVEAAARLLAEPRFELVKRCENPACTLWFFDRSKSHQRRWCSMGLCGNRHKVASFRKRQAAS